MHKEHTNLVCFIAGIFANFLAKICRAFDVIINVNEFSHRHSEFWVHLKVQFMPIQHQRMVELMAIMNFFIGANSGFVNEFNGSRLVAHNNSLDDNVNRNPQAIRRDEEIRQEISSL